MQLVEKMLKGDQYALSRLLNAVEMDTDEVPLIMKGIQSRLGNAYCIGFTGPPGAGKSTLVDKFTAMCRSKGLSVGIVAVDPTSPFSGGALLGDRIRMRQHYLDNGVFIRSMATRGTLGGLPPATRAAMKLLDAFGMDVILVETVGVGQVEVEVMKAVDSVVVVLCPEAGDGIQTMKAGLMEIADIFAVNKADRPGADQMVMGLESQQNLKSGYVDPSWSAHHNGVIAEAGQTLKPEHSAWRVPVIKTQAHANVGVEGLHEAIAAHRGFLERSGQLVRRRQEQLREDLLQTIQQRFTQLLSEHLETDGPLTALSKKVEKGELDPHTAAIEFLNDKSAYRDWMIEVEI